MNFTRVQAASIVAAIVWLLGLLTVFSFGLWSDFQFLGGTFFDNIDFLSNNILLPLGGLAIVIFAAWVMARISTADELDPHCGVAYRVWRFTTRFITPIAVVLVLLHGVGVF